MRVNQVISNIDRNSGGTATYIQGLSKALLKRKINLTVSTLSSKYPLNFDKEVQIKYCDENKNKIKSIKDLNFDLFHINGIWELFIHKMILLARKSEVLYIISPHGMLEQWSLNQGRLKKKIALLLFQKKDLLKSACIHVTAHSEMESVRKLGLNNPVAIIPNGIDLSSFPEGQVKSTKYMKTILFLSRIHPKKGIEFLIEAWEELDHPKKKNWQIKIIGNGDDLYIESLKDRIFKKKLSNCMIILPPIFDEEKKIEVFRNADVFVLPTFSENFGIVIAEALASYTPVITTNGTPWKELNERKCGWWINIGVDPLKSALIEVLNTNKEVLEEMGNNGRKLIEDQYSIESVANKTFKMYEWVINRGKKPNFIH